MAVRFGVIFITDNYTIDSVSQISQYQISHNIEIELVSNTN